MSQRGKTKPKRTSSEKEIRLFARPSDWEAWLAGNHGSSQGVWLRLGKKGSGTRSVTYAEALEVALCYGWIDGQKLGESEQAWLQRFLPRSARSIWSRINREKAQALIASGRMQAAGHAAIDVAKKNGNWDAAYESPKAAAAPPDFRAFHLERRFVVAVIQAQNRQHSRKGPCRPPVSYRAIALEVLLQESCRNPARPFIKVADHDAWPFQHWLCKDLRPDEDLELAPPFQVARSKMHVEDIYE